MVKNVSADAGDMSSVPALGRSHILRATEPVGPKAEAHEPYSLCCTMREATATRTQSTTRKSNNLRKPHAATRHSTVRKKSPHC